MIEPVSSRSWLHECHLMNKRLIGISDTFNYLFLCGLVSAVKIEVPCRRAKIDVDYVIVQSLYGLHVYVCVGIDVHSSVMALLLGFNGTIIYDTSCCCTWAILNQHVSHMGKGSSTAVIVQTCLLSHIQGILRDGARLSYVMICCIRVIQYNLVLLWNCTESLLTTVKSTL